VVENMDSVDASVLSTVLVDQVDVGPIDSTVVVRLCSIDSELCVRELACRLVRVLVFDSVLVVRGSTLNISNEVDVVGFASLVSEELGV
jgi:hypothetical protein